MNKISPTTIILSYARFYCWVLAFLFTRTMFLCDKFAWILLRKNSITRYVRQGACRHTGVCCQGIGVEFPASWIRYDALARICNGIAYFIYNFKFEGRQDKMLVYSCGYLTQQKTCAIYPYRPKICSEYPVANLKNHSPVHEGCGFYFVERKDLNGSDKKEGFKQVFDKKISVICALGLILLGTSPTALAKKVKDEHKAEPNYTQLNHLIFQGQNTSALELLSGIELKKTKGIWKERLQFIAAYLHLKTGFFDKAAILFDEARKSYPALQDYSDFYGAIALRKSGQALKSIELLNPLSLKKKNPDFSRKIKRELALAFCAAGDRGSSINMLNALIQMEPLEDETYTLRVDRAECLVMLKAYEEAKASLRHLYLNYPEGHLSTRVLQLASQLENRTAMTSEEHLHRALTLLAKKRPELAVIDIQQAMQSYTLPPLELQKKLSDANFAARNYVEAAKLYEEIKIKLGQLELQEQIQLAKAYARSDQFDLAIKNYQELLHRNPSDQAEYLYKITFLYFDKGDLEQAKKEFNNLLQAYPKHPHKENILWMIAWSDYLLRNFDQALAGLDTLQKNSPQGIRIPYWRARILEKQGHKALAQEIYRQISEEETFAYYGFLSLKRLEGLSGQMEVPNGSWISRIPQFKLPRPLSLDGMNAQGREKLVVLKELLSVGLWEDFLEELNELSAHESDSHNLALLKEVAFTQSNDIYPENLDSWQKNYPPAYAGLVELFTSKRSIPFGLAWAIMREESRFRPQVTSLASAYGLMQIIPPTGYEIAKMLGREKFKPDDLFRPVTNIEYGTHYLDVNFQHFNQNLVYTIASYNAGPDAVDKWVRARGSHEWDEWVEEIPYKETNNYVKKVLKSFYLYRLLYGRDS